MEKSKKERYLVPVHNGPEIVARVEYNQNLDFWDGRNWSYGGVGFHAGLTKLKNGKYVLIHGTNWQGHRDWGEVISAKDALQHILHSGNTEMLEEKRFSELKKMAEQMEEEE